MTTIIFCLFIGYFFEIFGRNRTIFGTTFFKGVVIILIPFAAPNLYPGLLILRIVVACT